jgi:hypothetical protein
VITTGTWHRDPADHTRIVAVVANQTIDIRIADQAGDLLRLEWSQRSTG